MFRAPKKGEMEDGMLSKLMPKSDDFFTDFEAQGQVRATWPDHLIATSPPARGIRRGRRGRT